MFGLQHGEGETPQRGILGGAVHKIYVLLGEVDLSIREGTGGLDKRRAKVEEASAVVEEEIERLLGESTDAHVGEEELQERLQIAEEDIFADQLLVGEEEAMSIFVSNEESRIQEIVLQVAERSGGGGGGGGGGAGADAVDHEAIILALREDAENDAETLARDMERDRQEMQLKLRERLARDRKRRAERKQKKTETKEESQLNTQLEVRRRVMCCVVCGCACSHLFCLLTCFLLAVLLCLLLACFF